jgi:hypothetical protein
LTGESKRRFEIKRWGGSVKLRAIGNAFRAQLIVPEQRQLFDYWLAQAGENTMPARSDIKPQNMARMLPCISLVDVADDLGQCRVRLAGTRLREIYDRDITGLHLDQLDWGDKKNYWLESYQHVIANGKPTQGVLRGPVLHKEHMIQYWLKLPLRTTSDRVGMVLCYDYFMPSSENVMDEQRASGE